MLQEMFCLPMCTGQAVYALTSWYQEKKLLMILEAGWCQDYSFAPLNTLSVLWDAFRRPLNPETAPLTFRFSMWSIIRKHLGRLVSGSEPPPLCCGSQFSISCNQFSMGSTIKLKQEGCKTGEADIPFTRLKQPSFLGLSLCALFNRLWPSLWSTGTGEPKVSKKEPGATGCPWTANSSVPRAWNTAEEKKGAALNAWHKGGRALSLEDQNCPVMMADVPTEAVRLRQVGAEANLPVHLFRGKDVLWVLLLDFFMPGKWNPLCIYWGVLLL